MQRVTQGKRSNSGCDMWKDLKIPSAQKWALLITTSFEGFSLTVQPDLSAKLDSRRLMRTRTDKHQQDCVTSQLVWKTKHCSCIALWLTDLLDLFGSGYGGIAHFLNSFLRLICLPAALLVRSHRLGCKQKRCETITPSHVISLNPSQEKESGGIMHAHEKTTFSLPSSGYTSPPRLLIMLQNHPLLTHLKYTPTGYFVRYTCNVKANPVNSTLKKLITFSERKYFYCMLMTDMEVAGRVLLLCIVLKVIWYSWAKILETPLNIMSVKSALFL